MYCVNIFNTRAQKLVNPQSYAVVALPRRGSMGEFGIYTGRQQGRPQVPLFLRRTRRRKWSNSRSEKDKPERESNW